MHDVMDEKLKPAGPTTTHGLLLPPIPSHPQALKGQLSPVQQYVQHQLQKLETGTTAEKAEAIKGLGEDHATQVGIPPIVTKVAWQLVAFKQLPSSARQPWPTYFCFLHICCIPLQTWRLQMAQ